MVNKNKIEELEKKLDQWFLGIRKGKAKDWAYDKRGLFPYSNMKAIHKICREVLE